MRNRYTVQEIGSTITQESAARADDITDAGEPWDTTLEGALQALHSGCWDNLDVRPGRVIGYPADYTQDLYTGDYSATQVAVSGEPKDIDHLMRAYDREVSSAR